MMEFLHQLKPITLILIGLLFGFLFSIFILDMYYRSAMKNCICEIKNQYNEINQKLIDKLKEKTID